MRAVVVCALLVLSGVPGLRAQDADQGAFIVRLGSDTIAVERFWRSGSVLLGRCLTRAPRTTLREYRVVLDSAGNVAGFALRRARPWVASDTAAAWNREPRGALAPAIPAIGGNCWGMFELATRRLVQGGSPTVALLTLAPGDPDVVDTVPLARIGRDSVTIELIANLPYRVAVDAAGRIRGARWAGDWSVERLPGLDLDALIAAFADRSLGPLSPADSVSGAVGRAVVSVRYSRPAARGRRVFGQIVPWNAVWRTGANEASIFTTSADLRIAGKTVPAGKYSLWTIPAPDGWTLILNRNTGQWGTDYDPQYDFIRVPMRVESLPVPVERFTIAIEPRGRRAVLRMDWETTRAWIELESR
jgi:DUF2911 family protein